MDCDYLLQDDHRDTEALVCDVDLQECEAWVWVRGGDGSLAGTLQLEKAAWF